MMLRSLNVSVSTSNECPVTLTQKDSYLSSWRDNCLFKSKLKSTLSSLGWSKQGLMMKIISAVGFPTSLTSVILFQWRAIMALLVMSSSRGQHSLNSSIVFLRSRKACHSFRARGSLRHLSVRVKRLIANIRFQNYFN